MAQQVAWTGKCVVCDGRGGAWCRCQDADEWSRRRIRELTDQLALAEERVQRGWKQLDRAQDSAYWAGVVQTLLLVTGVVVAVCAVWPK